MNIDFWSSILVGIGDFLWLFIIVGIGLVGEITSRIINKESWLF